MRHLESASAQRLGLGRHFESHYTSLNLNPQWCSVCTTNALSPLVAFPAAVNKIPKRMVQRSRGVSGLTVQRTWLLDPTGLQRTPWQFSL